MIPLGDRLNLITTIAADSRCGRVHLAIAHLLFCHFYNSDCGYAFPSVGTLAKAAVTDRRYARQAILDLDRWGYARVEIGRGAAAKFGSTNAYTACVPAHGMCPSAEGDPMRSSAGDAFQRQDPLRPSASKPLIEPLRDSDPRRDIPPPPPVDPLVVQGGKSKSPAAAKKESRVYLAKDGCTIDNYDPCCSRMAAWVSEQVPLIKGRALSQETIDEIKDVWRSRGERIKNFDATFRNYLRMRQRWATERQAKNDAALDPSRRAGMC